MRLLLAVLVLTGAPSAVAAGGGEISILLDAVSYPIPGEPEVRTVLYVSFPGEENPGGGSGFLLAAEFRGGGRDTEEESWVYRTEGDPLAAPAILTRTHYFAPGELKVKITVQDLDTDRKGKAEQEFEVRQPEPISLSDLRFGLCSPGGEWQPHPSRLYGEGAPGLCVRLSVADSLGRPDPEYGIRCQVRSPSGKVARDSTLSVPRTDGAGELELVLGLLELVQGNHRIQVDVTLGDVRASREGSFAVDESRVDVEVSPLKLRTVIGYVATNRERIELEETRDDSLAAFWGRFWARRDPEPESARNPSMEEFLRRVEYTSRNFGASNPGWRTDRARIYIRYGEADEIEFLARNGSRPDTEIWYYYRRNLSFVFHDVEGFGEYQLSGSRR